MSRKNKKCVYSGIGGQAVLEGVMMRNKNKYAVAVRKPDGKIEVDTRELNYDPKSLLRRIPFIRGIIVFADSLSLGMNIISYSASFYEEEEEETGFDRALKKIFGKRADDVVMGFTILCSVIMAIALFMLLPYGVSELLKRYVVSEGLVLLTEGILRMLVFIIYVAAIALMKDIKRLYQYHGAEHKCINCIESGRPLTVRNVKRTSRFHKRCGTSFLLLVVIIGIVLCFFIRTDIIIFRILYRLLMIPVVAGIAYELLRASGRKDNIFLNIVSAPGLWLQRITTKEPDDEMIEVAIASVEAVFDWRKFEKKHFKRRVVKKDGESAIDRSSESDVRNEDIETEDQAEIRNDIPDELADDETMVISVIDIPDEGSEETQEGADGDDDDVS
ncbi:Uncharacterized conserved protein YqhQ [Lachnospiraceae bacterium XPB1003]|nr:Uncharacterized conserved protein YqhQ [Lachnospiraceae bacterium XPB1003]